ncbi:flagellar basal body P-ring formation chaperone FlgA [Litoribrevibacter euphylliae]|uniref:Flagella basal body P-ring formation protein FlgA n=1 Tax=Litoribrevibacter euphylliae TaxID=1834034 RepID=A0ABV7H7X7_9GAMM
MPVIAANNDNITESPTATKLLSQSIKDVPKLIENFIQEQLLLTGADITNIEISSYSISSSLRLPSCREPLTLSREGSKNNFYGRNTVKVSCANPNWGFYSGASVKIYGEVLVAATPISRGEIITDDHLQTTRIDRSKINGNSVVDASSLIGLAAKRPIRQGKILTSSQFELPKLIERGDGVVIQAVGKGMTVSTAGEALSHGRLGENIRVRNIKSDREIIAKVKDKDTVVVMLY